MEISTKNLRKLVVQKISNVSSYEPKDNELESFLYMLSYYCIETGKTEIEVLESDLLFNRVFKLFKKHKPQLKENYSLV